jgi:hypothetical protein
LLLIFGVTLFVSATLLFLVQPMFAKMVLPLLGGTPSVWNTCMVFYQAALLAGYAYAHSATKWLGVRRQALLHLGLLLMIILTLPIGVARGWTPPAEANPIPWLLMLLVVSVGLPFFVISTTAPMLQKWFAHTGHAAAADPYFLYGASNLGSMIALLGYPLLVEPYWRLADQAWIWAGGYLVLAALILVCAILLWRSPASAAPAPETESEAAAARAAPVTLGQRLWWVLLAFAPSSLMLGVTTYLSTDIAAVPLLWVVPLALYLLTFVLVFARRPILPHALMVWMQPFFIIPLAILFCLNLTTTWQLSFPLHLLAFFLIAMVCHGELMKYRPDASHLTEFYLWMSVGGVLGGVFNALVAPIAFRAVIEYPLVIAVASMLRPSLVADKKIIRGRVLDYGLPLILFLPLAWLDKMLLYLPGKLQLVLVLLMACLAGVICFSFRFRPVRFGLGIGAIILAGVFLTPPQSQTFFRERNFFGVLQVRHDLEGNYHLLFHGTTLHGCQSLDPARRREPLTYYHRTGPLGHLFTAFSGEKAEAEVAVVGLGTGTIACYGRPGDHYTFYEIDPAVEQIAREPRYFTFLNDCPAKVEVVLGDARLSLQKAAGARYDLIILDAFSSDAIPIHLVTKEALKVYLTKLQTGGVLAFHISNRFLDLKPVLANLAREAGVICLCQEDKSLTDAEKKAQKTGSVWVAMVRNESDLPPLFSDPRWQRLSGVPGEKLWTDDFSNILKVFEWRSFDLNEAFKGMLPKGAGGENKPDTSGKQDEPGK